VLTNRERTRTGPIGGPLKARAPMQTHTEQLTARRRASRQNGRSALLSFPGFAGRGAVSRPDLVKRPRPARVSGAFGRRRPSGAEVGERGARDASSPVTRAGMRRTSPPPLTSHNSGAGHRQCCCGFLTHTRERTEGPVGLAGTRTCRSVRPLCCRWKAFGVRVRCGPPRCRSADLPRQSSTSTGRLEDGHQDACC
jgi:hypothetical protein